MLPGLQIGRIIHYVSPYNNEHQAGIITGTHGDTSEVTFTLFASDGTYSGETAVYDANCAVGTWHWPERS